MNEKAETPQERPGWVFDFQVSGKGEDKATNGGRKIRAEEDRFSGNKGTPTPYCPSHKTDFRNCGSPNVQGPSSLFVIF